MRALIVIALVFVIAPAAAAPKARSIPECRFFWDVALVARAMAIEGIGAKPRRATLERIYDAQGDARVIAIVDAINQGAGRRDQRSPGRWAADLSEACVQNRGDMDSVIHGRQA